MSTVPLPPDYYERPQPPPRRRRNWKRIGAWILGTVLVLTAGLLIGIVALMHNTAFRQYLLRVAYSKLREATGIELKMSDFSVHWSGLNPAVDMFNVVIDGAPPYQNTPLLRADRLSAGVQVVSLMQRKWYLKDIVLDHPVARVFVAENGDTNLPKPKSTGGQTDIFDLGIRHVQVGGGEVYYNDHKSALEADLHDLEFQSRFDPASKRYSGGLSYKNGNIHFQNLNPAAHSFEAEFEATPDSFRLTRSTLTSGASQLSVSATLTDYAHPHVTATYQSTLDTGELRQILKDTTVPAGIVKLAGSAQFESDPNKPAIETLELDGLLSSGALHIRTTSVNTVVRDIGARYSLKKGDAAVYDLKALVLGGKLSANIKMHDVTGAQVSELQGEVRNVSLPAVQSLIYAKAAESLRLQGTANAKVEASWRKTFDTLTADTDATVNGTISPPKGQGAGSIPLDSEIHARYSAVSQEISLTRSFIRMPQTSANLNGTVSRWSTGLQVQFQSNDLREVETAADVFGAIPQPLGLAGTASFNGTVTGSTTEPDIRGQLSAAQLIVKGSEWKTLRTAVDASPSHVDFRNGSIVPANNRGEIAFDVNVGLDQWAYRETNPIQISVNASQLNIADFKSLVDVKTPMTGTLSANVALHGSQLNPVGQGTVTLTQATIADEPIQSANIAFDGTGNEIHARAGVRVPAGSAQGTLTYFPKNKGYDAELKATGIQLDQLRSLKARNVQVAGSLDITAKGSGTFDNPGVTFTASIPRLQIQNQTISGLKLQADVADHVANATIDSQALDTYIRGHGKVELMGAYETDAVFDTSPISLQSLIAAYLPAQAAGITGQTEIHATMRGPLKDTTRLEAHITIPELSLAYKNTVQIAAAQPIKMDYAHGVLTVQKTSIRGTGTDLQVQATIPTDGVSAMSVLALGTIDLQVAQIFNPDVTSSGQVQFNINGYGRGANPNVQGQIKIVNASFAGDDLPIGLQNGNGVMTLTSSRLEIDQFTGKVSGGTLTARGAVTYRPEMQFNLVLSGTGIRTLYPAGVREGADTYLTLTGSNQSAFLRGQVRLNELSFSPDFDIADVAGVTGGANTSAPPGSFARNLNLDIDVQSTNDLNLASSKLSLQGAANLRIRGTAAEPAVLGRVNLTGGDLIFRGNRYLLQPSSLDFVNPYRVEPRVNLSVDTKVQQYDIHMLFRGNLDQLRTTYTSEPALPPSDIINLLVFGKTTEASEANPTPGNLGAESLIASQVSGQVTSRIEKIAGISQLSVDPVLGGSSQDTGARVTIQQRVTGNLFVTFSTDATSTQREVIKLEYQASRRVSLSGVRDQNGGFAFDVRIKKTW